MNGKKETPPRSSLPGLVGCAATWTVLNFALLACLDENADWRIQKTIDASTVLAYQRLSISNKNGDCLQARFLPPRKLHSPIPLVVFLHGAGERGRDNIQQLQTLPMQLYRSNLFTCSVLAPQCPPGTSWHSWIAELEEMIEQVIREHPIDPQRVYLTGLSMGGFGSWELAARRPELFAAVVPVCGGGRPEWARSLKSLPIWAVHGAEDRAVLPEESRQMIAAVTVAGGAPRLTELPGIGHSSWHYAYSPASGVLKWMFQQNKMESR